jgi:hypothetical protein
LRPENGESINPGPDEGTDGESSIKVINGSSVDAVLRLVNTETGRTARLIYIWVGNSISVEGIETGTYWVRFQSGKKWLPGPLDFGCDADYSEFEEPFSFPEDRVREYTITLNPVVGGTARTRRIDRRKFFEGDQYVRIAP